MELQTITVSLLSGGLLLSLYRIWKLQRALKDRSTVQGDQENLYQYLIESSLDPIVILQGGYHRMVNPAFTSIFGYTQQDVADGLPIWTLVQERDRERVQQRYEDRFNGDTVSKLLELDLVAKKGNIVPTHCIGSLITYEGAPATMVVIHDISKLREMQDQLIESEGRFRAFYEQTPDAVFIADSETGVIVDANPAASDLLLRPYEEIITMHQSQLHPARLITEVEEIFRSHVEMTSRSEKFFSIETAVVRSDGSEVPVYILASKLRQKGRQLIMGVFRDITEWKKAEDLLKKSQMRLSESQEIARIGTWEFDAHNNTLWWSDEIFRLFGLDRDAAEPSVDLFFSCLHPDDVEQVKHEIFTGKDYRTDYRVILPDGTIEYIHEEVKILEIKDGIPVLTRGTAQSVTDLKKVESALRESELKFRSLFNQATDSIMLMDTSEEGPFIVDCNDATLSMHGYSREEVIGKPISFLDDASNAAMVRARVEKLVKDGYVSFEVVHIRKDGTPFSLEVHAGMINLGEEQFILTIDRDISDRKKAEQKIEASLREKEVLLQEVHHRVKNNFQVIMSLLKLQGGSLADKHVQEMFRESENRIRSMALVHEMLYGTKDLSRIDFGLYVAKLTEHMFRTYTIVAERVRISVSIDNIFLSTDTSILLGLVVNELVSNAVKYAFPGDAHGTVTITMKVREIENEYELIVKDDGAGLPDAIDIWNTDTLGLKMVSNMVSRQLFGSIDVNVQGGTEFLIRCRDVTYPDRLQTAR